MFSEVPPVFAAARPVLDSHVAHWGHQARAVHRCRHSPPQTRETYEAVLQVRWHRRGTYHCMLKL